MARRPAASMRMVVSALSVPNMQQIAIGSTLNSTRCMIGLAILLA